MKIIKGRAATTKQKRAVIEAIYAAWVGNPDLRLGQLIDNSMVRSDGVKRNLFYIEDLKLAEVIFGGGSE